MADAPSILIAEDNTAMSRILHFIFERAGFHVTCCRNGCEAAATATKEHFDALLTDFEMPGMNGDELCAHVRRSGMNPRMQIFMVTAKGLELEVRRLRETYDLANVFSKPFSPTEIMTAVTESLAVHT